MVGSTAGKPGIRMVYRFAYAAGATGILANFYPHCFVRPPWTAGRKPRG